MTERWEWVEIIEPRTKEHMYANLATGECVWDPPPGVRIKKTDDNQWWELFDHNTTRFYYYNATSQRTVWHRPHNCDIIPLAKLQTLKQNTEVCDDSEGHRVKKEISTQTPERAHATPVSGRRVERQEHVRTGSVRSTHSTQTSPVQGRPHRHRHIQHQRQDSTSSAHQFPCTESTTDTAIVNGDRSASHLRRGSQTSQASISYLRKDSVGSPQRSLDSPKPARSWATQQRALEQHRSPGSQLSSSCGAATMTTTTQSGHSRRFQRQESFPNYSRDDMMGYGGRDTTSQYPDVSQITAVQVTPRPKIRSFPRTNPAYVGVHRRDGQPSYKKVNIDQTQPPTAIYNQCFYDAHPPPLYDPGSPPAGSFQMTQTYEYDDRGQYRAAVERSDSDTSHSSYGLARLQQDMTNSQTSQVFSLRHTPRHHTTDSQSSQGSLHVQRDSHSSAGSLRSDRVQDASQDSGSSLQSSPRHVDAPPQISPREHHLNSSELPRQRALVRRNSEPDYANLQIIAHMKNEKILSVENPVGKLGNKLCTVGLHSTDDTRIEDLKNGDSLRSGDSLSPAEFSNRQDTPSSVRSRSTQNSSRSHTSEGLPDQGYEESDTSSVFSTPSPKTKLHGITSHLTNETQHASLKRKKLPEKPEPVTVRQQTLEKSQSLQAELALHRPLSLVLGSHSEANVIMNPTTGSLHRQSQPEYVKSPFPKSLTPNVTRKLYSESDVEMFDVKRSNQHRKSLFSRKRVTVHTMHGWPKTDMENFALENLNEHRKGLLGKALPMADMLTWSKDVIQKPMLRTNDKVVKKEAPELFRLIQMYMGDRKAKLSLPNTALDIVNKGWSIVGLRDEAYMQLCRQTNDNKRDESLSRGWELMAICLSFFPPSTKFQSSLDGYIYRHLDPTVNTEKVPVSHFAAHCRRRLERISKTGAKKGLRKPTIDEVEMAQKSIFQPSMFMNTLEDIMLLQKDRYPDRKLPWIQTVLSEEVLHLGGTRTEGIFRVPGDIDEVNALKARVDQWSLPVGCSDPHVPASLLKLWYRELHESLIPAEFYDRCVDNYTNKEVAIDIVNNLPHINKLVLCYLIRFLQVFAAEDNVTVTKMDVNNLAMVMAPNCLRCESDEPNIMFENTRKEMGFMRTLMMHLDTRSMEGVI